MKRAAKLLFFVYLSPCFCPPHFPNFPALKSVMKLHNNATSAQKGESCSFGSVFDACPRALEKNLNGSTVNGLSAPLSKMRGKFFLLFCFAFGQQGKLHTEARNGPVLTKAIAATAKRLCHHVLPWAAGGWF